MRRRSPALVLLLLSPAIGGLRSGSAPPAASRTSRHSGFSDRHKLALVSGALCFFILILAPVREWTPKPPDNPTGMSLVGLTTLVFLLWLRWRVKQREKGATSPERSVTDPA